MYNDNPTIKNIDELNLIKKKISFSHKSFVLLILDANFSENSDLLNIFKKLFCIIDSY